MKKIFATLLMAGTFVLAGDSGAGLTPRGDARDYHSNSIQSAFDIGATLLGPDRVRAQFAGDLSRNYVVVEVGVYPKNGRQITVDPADFLIRVIESGQLARCAEPHTIGRVLQERPAAPGGLDVHPVAGIVYESGNGSYGATGRAHGVYTTTGVAVARRAPIPGSTDADRRTLEEELSDHALPSAATTQPVAGYLYFSLLSKKKDVNYEVIYEGREGRATLPVGRR